MSLAIGALQMLLDRGELKDWFGSTEIWIEAIDRRRSPSICSSSTPRPPTDRSFLNRDLLKDANCMVGTVLMFLVGIPLYGTMTLLPTMLQDLMNYPVMTTGLVTAPRGIGTMIAMFLVGAAGRPGRHPADHPDRARADRALAVADDRVFAADGDGADHLDRGAARLWARLRLHAAQHRHLLDPAAAAS